MKKKKDIPHNWSDSLVRKTLLYASFFPIWWISALISVLIMPFYTVDGFVISSSIIAVVIYLLYLGVLRFIFHALSLPNTNMYLGTGIIVFIGVSLIFGTATMWLVAALFVSGTRNPMQMMSGLALGSVCALVVSIVLTGFFTRWMFRLPKEVTKTNSD